MDLDLVTKLAGLAINLDTVVEVLLKRGAVEKTIACGAGKVDDMLRLDGGLGGGLRGLHKVRQASLLRRGLSKASPGDTDHFENENGGVRARRGWVRRESRRSVSARDAT